MADRKNVSAAFSIADDLEDFEAWIDEGLCKLEARLDAEAYMDAEDKRK